MSDFGSRIRIRRKELGYTLREFSAKCGLSTSYLCALETGKRGVGADSLLAISGVLGIPMDQLMKGVEGGRQTPGVDVQLPQSLMTFAREADLSFRHTTCLFWLARTIMDHRTNAGRVSLEQFDWLAFHQAVKSFL